MRTTRSSPEEETFIDSYSTSDDHQHNTTITINKQNYKILNKYEIHQRINDEISKISNLLSLPKHHATLLLCNFNWSVTKIRDAWFADEFGVRLKFGLLKKPLGISATEFTCGICYKSFSCSEITSAVCGHRFCNDCWWSCITPSINNDGVRYLVLRCPQQSCSVSVGKDMVGKLVVNDDKHSGFLINSYVEGTHNIKWCPGAGCVYAIVSEENGGFDVTCHCYTSFCWDCGEETHRPLDCETVKKWILKNHSESGKEIAMQSIEKYADDFESIIFLSPYAQSLEKYTHYFERWNANRNSRLKALKDFEEAKNVAFKKLSEVQDVPEERLDFLHKAWLQVIECWRVLQWSYAYGYYMPDEEHAKKQFFEYLQREAEKGLEKLHHLTEKEVKPFIDAYDLSRDFNQFRQMLIGLTDVTGNYFKKLVSSLENGLPDVVSYEHGASSSSMSWTDKEIEDYWLCDRCTFVNPGSVSECEMCLGL